MTSKDIILITGGAGLVGKAIETIVKQDPKENETFVFLSTKDGDLRDMDKVEALFEKYQPTYVIHLAALVGTIFKNQSANLDIFRHNMLMNDNVIECCFKYKQGWLELFQKFGLTKTLPVLIKKGYQVEHGSIFTSVIPCNVFGPFDNYNIDDGHVLPGLMHKVYKAKQTGEPLTVWGTGKPLRQFIYSLDLARLILLVLREYEDNLPIILSVDESEEMTIKEAAEMVIETMGFTNGIQFDTSRADGQFKKTASNGRLRKRWPDFEFTPFKQALKESCDWFTENYDDARK